jgi:hypothetical protein
MSRDIKEVILDSLKIRIISGTVGNMAQRFRTLRVNKEFKHFQRFKGSSNDNGLLLLHYTRRWNLPKLREADPGGVPPAKLYVKQFSSFPEKKQKR